LGYSRAEASDRIGKRAVPRELDEVDALGVQLGLRLGKAWHLGLAWRYHGGWPATPSRLELPPEPDAEESEEDDENEALILLGPLRSARLPAYHRLDLRASRSWPVGRGELTFFVDVQNVYDRGNAAGFDLSIEEDEDGVPALVVEEETWPGFFPSLGIVFEL
jgi:hypothetical protein